MLIGCDPEFSIYKPDGTYDAANEYIRNNRQIGLGCDGHAATAEIRPGMCESPFELVGKIRTVLEKQALPDFGNHVWIAGHYANAPLGGHIHFEAPPHSVVVDNLDSAFKYVADKIEHQGDRAKRNLEGYGRFGDVREKYYGFEYRVPPSWLVSPAISLAYLTIAKAIAVLSIDSNKPISIKNLDNVTEVLSNASSAAKNEDWRGIDMVPALLLREVNWKADFRPAWGFSTVAEGEVAA
jgi:hypothetical protein